MAQVSGARTTNQAITETRLVRNVANKMAELEPNEAAILTFLTKLENPQEVDAPRRCLSCGCVSPSATLRLTKPPCVSTLLRSGSAKPARDQP